MKPVAPRTTSVLLAQLIGGSMRAIVHRDRRRELNMRLVDFFAYDAFQSAIAREHFAYKTAAVSTEVPPLLVTTNEGLFVLSGGRWRALLPITCFGVARHDGSLFLGASAGLHSFILAGNFSDRGDKWSLCDIRVLTRFETRYHNERVHQIAYDKAVDLVRCAVTRRSSILTVDPEGKVPPSEQILFCDATGFPLHTDQAHVNTVTPHGKALMFAMHNAGTNGSALGFVYEGRVRAYSYTARGVHDLLIFDDALMFTDSFRPQLVEQRPDASGAIRHRGAEYLQEEVDAIKQKLVLRGLTARDGLLVVGFSQHAKRSTRLDGGGGGVLIFKQGRLQSKIDGPFSQVYDVLHLDGERSDGVGSVRTPAELHAMFQRDVGPLIYDRPVPQGVALSRLLT